MTNKFGRWTVALVAAVAVVGGSLSPVDAMNGGAVVSVEVQDAYGVYDGRIINMADDWEGATACLVAPDVLNNPECFETEQERDLRAEALGLARDGFPDLSEHPVASLAASSCGGYVKLYKNSSYGGQSLWLSGRLQWFNMSSFGMDQSISSFQVQSCSAYFADLAGGGGGWYPTSQTQAWDVNSNITGSWNNDISSVYIT